MTIIANLYCNLAAWTSGAKTTDTYFSASGNAYHCVLGGTSATTPSGTSTTPTSFGSDTSQWVWLSAITFSGATASAVFTAAIAGATTVGGLTGTITQPIVWWLWYTGATWQVSAAGTAFLSLTGHAFTTTNTFTMRPAPGNSINDQSPGTPLAFNATGGVSFTLPATGSGGINYFTISDPNVTIDSIQFKDPNSTSGSTIVFLNGANTHFRNCIVDGFGQSGGAYTLALGNVTGLLITNTLFIDRRANAAIQTIGDPSTSTSTGALVNCTFVATTTQTGATNSAVTINSTASAGWVARNCVSIGYSGGIMVYVNAAATDTTDHCASDVTTVSNAATNTSPLVSQTAANMFVSTTTDFRLKLGSPLIGKGTPDATNIPTTDDFFRVSRTQGAVWSIGADEYPFLPISRVKYPPIQIWDH